MPCLTGSIVTIGSSWSLFVQDRYRRVWWLILIVLSGSWWAYFGVWREKPLLISLEVLSTLYVLTLVARISWRIFVMRKLPPGFAFGLSISAALSPYLANRISMALGGALAMMAILEKLGRADFTRMEYSVLLSGLCAWMFVILNWRAWGKTFVVSRFRRMTHENADAPIEPKTPDGRANSSCPLGY
ncbi:MAG: hypothetical protein J0M12_06375 [Deltaproteobacteria bacterium]|nr:hypothetical protein [Deltaproteobacteria bacterium]